MNKFSVKDKVYVITGATGYLGSQMVKDLHALGARVAVLSQSSLKAEELCKKYPGSWVKPYQVDLKDKESVFFCMKSIFDEFGCIDVLVNNAFFGVNKSFYDTDEGDWDTAFDGTVKSAHRCVLACIPYFKKSISPRVINIASMYGMVVPDPSIYPEADKVNPLGYGVGKAAMIHYTKYAAMILAEHKITVNTISYGPFPNQDKGLSEVFIQNLAQKTCLKRIGSADDVTAAIYFLSMSESGYVTGQNIVVDGGWTVW